MKQTQFLCNLKLDLDYSTYMLVNHSHIKYDQYVSLMVLVYKLLQVWATTKVWVDVREVLLPVTMVTIVGL